MRSLLPLIAALAACSHPSSSTTPGGPPSGSWHGPDALANVPADTPYVFALLEPPSDVVRKRMLGNLDAMVLPALKETAAVPLDARLSLPPPRRALLGIMDAMRGTDPTQWWENLGFKHNGHWVLYGLGIWPVLRVEVGDAAKLRTIVTDAVKTLSRPEVEQRQLGAVPYWIASKNGVSAIVAVTEHDAVVAVVPSQSLDKLVPFVLGTQRVEHSLRDSGDLAAMMTRYHLVPTTIGYIDARRTITALERHDVFSTAPLFSAPACHADYERLAAAMSRMVIGYRRLDDQGFATTFAFETSPEIAKQLAALHAAMPAPPDVAHALLSFVVAADADAGLATLRGWLQGLSDHPFECPQLAGSKQAVAEALAATDHVIPQELHGLHGFELVHR